MRMSNVFYVFVVSLSCVCAFAAVASDATNFKMTADKTNLVLGGDPSDSVATVQLWAYVNAGSAVDLNGINAWNLSVLPGTDGVVEVIESSISLIAPTPLAGAPDTGYDSSNFGNGEILNLRAAVDAFGGMDSAAGVGDYSLIAEFQIQAAQVGTVSYEIGDYNFGGFQSILRDYNPLNGSGLYEGSFDLDASNSVFQVTAVPEPTSLLILSGLGMISYLRRKR